MFLYEVLFRVGEDERSKFVLALSEEDLVAFLDGQALGQYSYIERAENPELTFTPGPNLLTRRDDGLWVESVV